MVMNASTLIFVTQISFSGLVVLVYRAIAQSLSSPELSDQMASELFALGWQQFDQGQVDDALVTFQTLLLGYCRLNNGLGVESALNCISFVVADSNVQDTFSVNVEWTSEAELQRQDDIRQDAIQLNDKGNRHRQLNEWLEALRCYESALRLFQQIHDVVGIGLSLNNIGIIHLQQGKCDRALALFQAAVRIFEDTLEPINHSTAMHNLGVTYFRLEEAHQAQHWLKKSLSLRVVLQDVTGQIATLSYLGTVYRHWGDYEQALAHYKEAFELCQVAKQTEDTPALCRQEAVILGHLATLCQLTGHPSLALEHYHQALELLQILGDEKGVGRLLNGLGNVYERLGDTVLALSYYQQALDQLRLAGDQAGQQLTLASIDKAYQTIHLCDFAA